MRALLYGSAEERRKAETREEERKVQCVKKNKALFILLGVLLVLLIVYFALQSWNRKQEEKESEDEAVVVTDIDPEDITAISYDAGDGARAFEKQDGTWVYTTDADFPLKQDFPETIAEDMGQLRADRELVDGDELADYGLEEPVYTVTLTQSDGTVTEIYFGNTVDDYYYVTVNDDGVVYTVSSTAADNLTQSLDEMAQLDEYPSIGSGNLKKVSITENGETTVYDSENEDQSEDISGIAGGLGAVTLSEAADYSVADADLAGYGLDEASRITVEVTYTEDDEDKTMTLYIGGDNGDSSRYVMIDDSRIVYLISDEICSNILNED